MGLTYFITGANRGIGLELARQMSARGDTVIGTARDPERAQDLATVASRVIRLDVADRSSVVAAAADLGDTPIDALVNNTGSAPAKGSIGELDLDAFEREIAIHALGPVRVTSALLPNLRAGSRKLIVTLSSELGSNEIARGSLYYGYMMGKAGANMFTTTLGADLRSEGFTCLAIHPGWVSTQMGGASAPVTPTESVQTMIETLDKAGPERSGAYVNRFGEGMPY
jgi:NAD(P)-dependent dehydrogenase (short-subunit alcohol dehydrogenase family)